MTPFVALPFTIPMNSALSAGLVAATADSIRAALFAVCNDEDGMP